MEIRALIYITQDALNGRAMMIELSRADLCLRDGLILDRNKSVSFMSHRM